MRKKGKKEDKSIKISAGILIVIIAMFGFYLKVLYNPPQEILRGEVGELYTEAAGNQAPTVGMVNPSFIEAYPQTEFSFSSSYSDSDGISDLIYARLIIDQNIDNFPNYTAMIDYYPNTNSISVYDQDGNIIGGVNSLVAKYSFEENIG